ncbi:MAG TPA: hypothetical protein VFO39_19525 [Candidatus Sulfotelmatobacter sp.]|nr:hypothetical protein [Candidatus Sulfotelmatobacter sp.]
MRDITELMNTYRECSRNLWNLYFSRQSDTGAALDAFREIRNLLFDSIVVSELFYEGEPDSESIPPPVLKVVPDPSSAILVAQPTEPGQATYWDREKDMVVGPNDVQLQFLDYFDFRQTGIVDFRFYRCKILRFPSRPDYEGREALIEALGGKVFHDEDAG